MANRAKLESESDKLIAAHFADAIDLPTLKRHQDRIRAGLAEPFATIFREAHDSGDDFLCSQGIACPSPDRPVVTEHRRA
ncbi:MAG: hypothetical protein QM607_12370 [Microbacterium sp.]